MEKNYCSSHPKESITNFCRKVQCLKQLCPVCICSHTQKHQIMKSLPQYEPINETFKNCQNLIERQVNLIENSKNGVAQHRMQWQKRKKAAMDKIDEAEKQAISTVLQTFDEIRNAFNSRIQTQQARIGLKDNYKISNIMNIYDEEIDKLHMYHQQLSSTNKIHYIKTLLKEVLPANGFLVNSLSKDFSKMLKNNIAVKNDLMPLSKSIRDIINYNVSFRVVDQQAKIMNSNSAIFMPIRRQPLRPTSNIVMDNRQSVNVLANSSGLGFYPAKVNNIPQRPLLKTAYSSSSANTFTNSQSKQNTIQVVENTHITPTQSVPLARPCSQSRSNSKPRRSSIFSKTGVSFKAL